MNSTELTADLLEAQLREAEARLDVVQAQAAARHAEEDMAEISGLRAAQAKARQSVEELKQRATVNLEVARSNAEAAVHDLRTRLDRVNDRFVAFDDASERRFNARLDQAEAQLRVWKAQLDQSRADDMLELLDDLNTLEERIAASRARFVENAERGDQRIEDALDRTAARLEQAYEAVAKRFER